MRNMMIGMGAAVLSAAVLVFATPAAAASKPCWAHYDATLSTFVAVWSNGGGHSEGPGGHGDYLIDFADTRLDCETLFAGWSAPA
jgi:hypothetical protein